MTVLAAKNKVLFRILLVFSFVLATITIPPVLATEGTWVTKASLWQDREGLGVAVVDGQIYAIGGCSQSKYLDSIEVYDPLADTWSCPKQLLGLAAGSYRTPMPTPRSNFGIAVVDGKIYCIGGWTENNETAVNEVYDPKTDTWETKTPMSAARSGITANVVDGKIYVTGGSSYGSEYAYCYLTEVYDPETDSWTLVTPIPTAVAFYASAVVDNKIYIFGGHNGENLTQIYDPQTGNWSFGTQMPYSATYVAAGATTGMKASQRIYVLGGVSAGLNQIYDPENDSWTLGPEIPTPRHVLAVAVLDDTIYTLGGIYSPPFGLNSPCTVVEQYTPAEYIPEFLSWIVLPLFLVVCFVVMVVRWKIFRPT